MHPNHNFRYLTDYHPEINNTILQPQMVCLNSNMTFKKGKSTLRTECFTAIKTIGRPILAKCTLCKNIFQFIQIKAQRNENKNTCGIKLISNIMYHYKCDEINNMFCKKKDRNKLCLLCKTITDEKFICSSCKGFDILEH